MPYFECTVCHSAVAYPDCDRALFEAQDWECNLCLSVIARPKYRQNIPGGVTLFSPMSSALGDIVCAEVIRRKYAEANPDEDINWLGYCEPDEAIQTHSPDKFFWANVTNFIERPANGVIPFFLENESSQFAAVGEYPRLWFTPAEVGGLPAKYIVFHVRNVRKATFKNAEPMIVFKLTMEMDALIQQGVIDGVVLVGNDSPVELEMLPRGFVDLRHKLTVEQIAFVLQHSRGMIGKDSGIAHLAAACGCRVVAWGFRDVRWVPKAPPDQVRYMMQRDSNPYSVTDLFNEHIRKGL